jgi:hypothetical protein
VTAVVDAAALIVVAAAILAGALALGGTRSVRQALPVLLDLLTAAGLLRLSVTPTWSALAVTAVVVALRRLTTAGLRRTAQARRSTS